MKEGWGHVNEYQPYQAESTLSRAQVLKYQPLPEPTQASIPDAPSSANSSLTLPPSRGETGPTLLVNPDA